MKIANSICVPPTYCTTIHVTKVIILYYLCTLMVYAVTTQAFVIPEAFVILGAD